MQRIKFLILALILTGCSNKTSVVRYWENTSGIQKTAYFICKRDTPIYKFGSKEFKYEFYGEDAETRAHNKCNEIQ